MYEKESAALKNLHELFEVSTYAVDLEGTLVLEESTGCGFDAVGSDEALRRKLISNGGHGYFPGGVYTYTTKV